MSSENNNSYQNKYSVPPIHICTQCKKEFEGTRCPYCGTEAPTPTGFYYSGSFRKKPTALWYLLPFLFGIFGGIVAYVGVKGEDTEMADTILILSIIWSVILFILFYLIFL